MAADSVVRKLPPKTRISTLYKMREAFAASLKTADPTDVEGYRQLIALADKMIAARAAPTASKKRKQAARSNKKEN